MHSRNDQVRQAYHDSKSVYDNVLTQKNLLSRLYVRLFWSGTDDRVIAAQLLSWIPDDFPGKILDVPAGTAVFTEQKWKALQQAEIVCLDCSSEMLEEAQKRLHTCRHVKLMQGDASHLPFADESFDLVLSMNGFHAFSQKEQAWKEMLRVLKPGGEWIACFYVRGESRITDWLVSQILSRKGWFSPPFLTMKEVSMRLNQYHLDAQLYLDGSMAYFRAYKNHCGNPQ